MIEENLLRLNSIEDRLLFNARLQLDSQLRENTATQKLIYELVQLHSRKELTAEILKIQSRLFNEPRFSWFQQKVKAIFN